MKVECTSSTTFVIKPGRRRADLLVRHIWQAVPSEHLGQTVVRSGNVHLTVTSLAAVRNALRGSSEQALKELAELLPES